MGRQQPEVSNTGEPERVWGRFHHWVSAARHWVATLRARVAEQTVLMKLGAYRAGSQESNATGRSQGVGVVVLGLTGLLVASFIVVLVFLRFHGSPDRDRLRQGGDQPRRSANPAQSLLRSFPAMPQKSTDKDLGGLSTSARLSVTTPPTNAPPQSRPPDLVSQLPTIYPKLVLPHAHTRLAVPVEPLAEHQWDIDVLGLSGVPLLCASLAHSNMVSISLHNVNTLLATVSAADSSVELRGSGGTPFGTLFKEQKRHVLKDVLGRPILALSDASQDFSDLQLTAPNPENPEVFAVCKKRPAEHNNLPAEHYELVAKPGVDSVLVLACMLGALVFQPHTSG